jgi:hypothetical protein
MNEDGTLWAPLMWNGPGTTSHVPPPSFTSGPVCQVRPRGGELLDISPKQFCKFFCVKNM